MILAPDTIKKQTGPYALAFILTENGFLLDRQIYGRPVEPEQLLLEESRYRAFQKHSDQAFYELAFSDRSSLLTPSCRFLAAVSRCYLKEIALRPEREDLREAIQVELDVSTMDQLIQDAPFVPGTEHLSRQWIKKMGQRWMRVFRKELSRYSGSVAAYLSDRHASFPTAGRVVFHLVENKKGPMPFAFLATYTITLDQTGRTQQQPLDQALLQYQDDPAKRLDLLATVTRAARQSALIQMLLESGELFHPIGLTADEAYQYFKEIPLYEASGILCRVPNWWKKRSHSARLTVTVGSKAPSMLGLQSMVDMQKNLQIGDLDLSETQLRALLSEAEGLRSIKGKWVVVDHKQLQAVLQAFDQLNLENQTGGLSLIEAMRLILNGNRPDADTQAQEVEVLHGDWLAAFAQKIKSGRPASDSSCGTDFHAELRPYQKEGVAWLGLMKSLGLGACLADDMGLGKTVQVLGLLNGLRRRKREKTLLVVPASLIDNWRKEAQRFCPGLQLCVLHPSENKAGEESAPEDCDMMVTTYSMVHRYSWLKETVWDTLILDEAQAIKNPGSRQTRAVKGLQAHFRLALTGTPIENRIGDLWSLFDFLNRGLLGTAKEFTELAKKLEREAAYGRLKQVISPFILRRLKTDRSIINDLPEKVDMKTYASLSSKQTVLYQALVDEIKDRLEQGVSGMERKGLVLSSILKLKQICNHPDQYLGQPGYRPVESGKFGRLKELCETIIEKRERVLIFTQFREMIQPLQHFLAQLFAHPGLVLHGGTPVAKRKTIIDTFQGDAYVPFLVLSVKAGGIGLNLTAANHVIHFDRWWNPAVENQATDRAFRIGQDKKVVVHKMVMRHTIEEKIDQMIEAKKGLAERLIPTQQEAWITELDDTQLMDLFHLTG